MLHFLFEISPIQLIFCQALISTMNTDGLVLQHQGIGSYRAEYAHMRFMLFMDWHIDVWAKHDWWYVDDIFNSFRPIDAYMSQ